MSAFQFSPAFLRACCRDKSSMDLSTIKESFEEVVKKRELSSSKTQELIDQVGTEIEQGLTILRSDDSVDHKQVLDELKARLESIGSTDRLKEPMSELNNDLKKHQKLLDKALIPEICKASRSVDFDTHTVNQVILNHLYRKGQFNIADCLVREAGGDPEASSSRSLFQELHGMLEAMKSEDYGPALNWLSLNHMELNKSGIELALELHNLNFLNILQKSGSKDALDYATSRFFLLASSQKCKMERIMGALLWERNIDQSPYANLLAPANLERLAKDFTQTFYYISRLPIRDPLDVVIAAGAEALPTLLTLKNVMTRAGQQHEWETMKKLPVSVDIVDEFQFHSVIVCPVCREETTEENPAWLLTCGHVVCLDTAILTWECPMCKVVFSLHKRLRF